MNMTSDQNKPKGRWHDRLVTLTVAVTGGAVVAGLWRFLYQSDLSSNYEMYLVGNTIALLFIPMLVILFFGEEPSSFGFGIGNLRRMKLITLALFAGLLVLVIPASRTSGFQGFYPIFRHFTSSIWGGYESPLVTSVTPALIYGWVSYGLYMFCWEFFFRGYLLFGLFRTIKWPAIIIQAAAFTLLHSGKVSIEVYASFPAGIILGMLALKSKSFVPGFFLHWAASVTFDVLVLMSSHK
jgi:membrane protease YdiL (CAAX protease family)